MISSLADQLTQSFSFFVEQGVWGLVLYAVLIFGVQFCGAPVSPLAIGAGLVFGLRNGFATVALGTALGIGINFLVARYVARGVISRRMMKNEKLRLIDQAIGREGWKIIALLRFTPLPFGLANFCYGLTAVSFWPYFFTSVITIAPANFFFVWLGSTAGLSAQAALGKGRPRHPLEYVLLGVGILAFFCALLYVSRVAREAVARKGLDEPVA